MLQAQVPHESGQGSRMSSRSNIPTMRRERRQNQEAAARTLRVAQSREHLQQPPEEQQRPESNASSKRGYKGGEVRWDPNTGELTSSVKGRPSQVKPAEYARGLLPTGRDEPGNPVDDHSPTAKPTGSSSLASFASRLRRTVQNGAAHIGGGKAQEAEVEAAIKPLQPASPASLQPTASPARHLSTSTDPAATAFTSNRPAWHGASGRTTLVAPVTDTKEVPPLNIPRKSSKRVGSLPKLDAGIADHATIPQNKQRLASPPVSPSRDEPILQEPALQAAPYDEEVIPPAPPPHDMMQTPTPASRTVPVQSYPSPPPSADVPKKDPVPIQQRISQIKRKPAPGRSLGSYDDDDPFNYNNKSRAVSSKSVAADQDWTQPPSRFSAVTYYSAQSDSELDFEAIDAPEMPAIPDNFSSGQTAEHEGFGDDGPSHSRPRPPPIVIEPLPDRKAGEGVMDRRRPLCMGHASPRSIKDGTVPVVISLNTSWKSGNRPDLRDADSSSYMSSSSSGEDRLSPMPTHFRLHMADSLSKNPHASEAGSVHKDLPPAPPETTAKDRITMLNAQLADLAQRRFNVDRSIKQMTELMPTDNILASAQVLLKREQEKSKVEGLRLELSEIQREEYEIGLRLHRAYKRLDHNAEYEPTTLWVRRVTG